MLARRNPHDAYRRIEFDARIAAASPRELVKLCYEQLISSLGRALIANERGDNTMKSEALTRAVSSLNALQMGVSGVDGVASALLTLYGAARRSVLDSVLSFDAATLARIRQDFIEISEAMPA